MRRREFALGLCSLTAASFLKTANAASRGPLFWRIKRGDARVYLLGFGEANDRSWFTTTIQAAFEQSSTLWTEVGPPASMEQINQLYEQYGVDSQRTFLDTLEPSVRGRAVRYMEELAIDRRSIEHMKPWRAYYVLASRYGAKYPASAVEPVDRALLTLGISSGKTLRFEHPSFEAFVKFMAGLPDRAQSQYIAWLLDYFDAAKKGGAEAARYDWITGKADTTALDNMRKLPDLYRVMQLQRNHWWAQQIQTLLGAEGRSFVGVGMLHVLGPDGIPSQLQKLGVDVQESAEFA